MSASHIVPNPTQAASPPLDERSLHLRRVIVRMLEASSRGHLGSALSLVEIVRVLYDDVLNYDAKNPQWPNRDRFILSKGQGCLSLYVILAEKGFFPESELWQCGKSDGLLGGHPEIRIPGVEASTGSLGHGLSIGVGMALAATISDRNYRVGVVVGDGELNEGAVWEAAMSASKHQLSNLVVFVDYNKMQSYGPISDVLDLEPMKSKWESFGFETMEIDGHDIDAMRQAKKEPHKDQPLIFLTIKTKNAKDQTKEGNYKS